MLSDARFAQVIYTLREADAYFYAEARCRHAFHKPTHHAKRRAIRLNLRVDTRKAANLPTMEAYARRDPEIVQTYSPVNESNTRATAGRVSGPTVHDLLNANAALSEYILRITTLRSSDNCNQLMCPPSGYTGYVIDRRSSPNVPSVALAYPDCTDSSHTSGSSSMVTTPEDKTRPFTIRINLKRRSCEVEEAQYAEKRPKYGRKHWVPAF